jgi:hypothetical protein
MNRRAFVKSAALASAYALAAPVGRSQSESHFASDTVQIRTQIEKRKLPHVWKTCIGSDRASVGSWPNPGLGRR